MTDILERYKRLRRQVEQERIAVAERVRQIDMMLLNLHLALDMGRKRRSKRPKPSLCNP